MARQKTYVMAVAFDLSHGPDGSIDLGPETVIACDRAVAEAKKFAHPELVATAGMSPRNAEHPETWMGKLMTDRMKKLAEDGGLPGAVVHTGMAGSFNTSGEMRELARIVKAGGISESLPRVVIVVKWWHAQRAAWLCRYWFRKKGLRLVPIEIVECESNAGFVAVAKEYLGAWPKNLLKMAFKKL